MRTARSHQPLFVLLLVAIALLTLTTPIHAVTFTVDDAGDASDASAGNGLCQTAGGVCTLRAAIEEANALVGDDIIGFSGVTLVNIATELAITSNITINGTGVTVDNTGAGRVFLLTSATVTINGLTITGGDTGGSPGGGIRITGGSLTLQNGAVVSGNASGGGGGGGVYASNAQVIISGSGTQITGNTDSTNGAGLNLQAGADGFLQDGAVISNNTGPNSGGGVAVAGTGTTFTVDNASVSNNTAQSAAGITAFLDGFVTLQNGALISGNTATLGSGGGVSINFGAGGLSVSDTRFVSNTAAANGDAIQYSMAGNATIVRSCFTNNGDTAISNSNTGLIDASGGGLANANWWGTSWGPRIAGVAGSQVSNGDSISGNGTSGGSNRVDVGWATAGDGFDIPPTGLWLTSPPTVGGVQCQVCTAASSVGHARICS